MKSTSCVLAALCCLLVLSISVPAFAANIAWVSFHSADGTPSTAAGTAGFTQAPDVGYTQALTAAGHNVTRFVTHDNPTPADLVTLNAADLIIVSRSVASGHYQDPPETLFWNTSVVKPLIHMGGYAIRANRLGLYTGNTIPDTVGDVRLTVANPSHPIFAGVALDGTNTMVNPYAVATNAPFAPNNLQRGISVVTEPIVAGGQLLATAPVIHPTTMATVPGAVVAFFPTGTQMADAAPADIAGGPRLMFLSGTRENAANANATPPIVALTSEGSGIYDLGADGGRMFLNAVNFMLVIPEPNTAMLLAFAAAGLGMLRKR
jgi:hypothetical protein